MQVSTYNEQSEAWNTPIDIEAKAENIEFNNREDLETAFQRCDLNFLVLSALKQWNELSLTEKIKYDTVNIVSEDHTDHKLV